MNEEEKTILLEDLAKQIDALAYHLTLVKHKLSQLQQFYTDEKPQFVVEPEPRCKCDM